MLKKLLRAFAHGVALLMCSTAALAADATIVDASTHYEVQADGRHTVEKRYSLRINTPQGVQQFGQVPLPYSASLQTLDVLAAWVVGKDGTRSDVPADRIMVQQSPQSAGAPMFDDGKVKTVVFPGVEPGAVLHLHTRKTQLKALFPGHFSMVEMVPAIFDVQSVVVTLRAPAALKLHIDAVAMSGGAAPADRPGTQRWRWEVKGLTALPTEIGSVSPLDHSPRLAVTTFANDEAAAESYRARALPQAALTPAVQALADEITKGVSDRRAQADAIYRWVAGNIRYVAIFLDVGGLVPHAADDIAKARYGDCKDHTTLLGALLAARGIKSSPVLVNSDLRFWKPAVAVTPGVFNHVILQVPEFGVYLDSTAGLATFGTLSITLRGKPAVVVDGGDGRARLVTLPLSAPATERVRVVSKMTLGADGSIAGHADVEGAGLFDQLSRQILSGIPAGAEAQVAGRVLAMTGQNGSGSFTRGEPRDLTQPHRYTTDFVLPGYVQLPGPGAFVVPAGFSSFTHIAATFELLGLPQRTLPMPMLGKRVEETVTLHWPAGFTPTVLPRATQLKWAHGSYASTVTAEGSAVTISRVLDLSLPGPLLAPADYAEFRAFGQAVMRDLRAQIVY